MRRLAAVAMPELLTATRTPTVRRLAAVGSPAAGVDARPGLASGFGPSVAIVPASVAGSSPVPSAAAATALAVPGGGLGSTPPRPTVRRSPTGAAVGTPATTSVTTSGTPAVNSASTSPLSAAPTASGSTAQAARRASASGGTVQQPGRGPAAHASTGRVPAGRQASGPVAIARSYLPAPPPISIRPAPVSGPELPAAARGLAADAGRDAVPAVVRRSLADTLGTQAPAGLAESTAHLFQAARLADPPIRRSTETSGGSPVTTPGQFTVRRTLSDSTTDTSQLDIDDIVERVIDKIEQRVVDELERRGRYNSDGAF